MGRFAEGKKPLSEAVARTRDDFYGVYPNLATGFRADPV